MGRHKKLYEGKAKILYEGPKPGTLIQHFKDDATAFNAQKKATLEGKGVPEQPDLRVYHVASRRNRYPNPLHRAPQHARTADQKS